LLCTAKLVFVHRGLSIPNLDIILYDPEIEWTIRQRQKDNFEKEERQEFEEEMAETHLENQLK
jgi:hypothetical protein